MDFRFKDKNGVLRQVKFNPTQAQQRALDSGIDNTKVAQIEINKNNIDTKQEALTQTQLNAINSGIDITKVAQIETNRIAIGTKQNLLTDGAGVNIANDTISVKVDNSTIVINNDTLETVLKIWTGTQSDYDAIQEKDNNTIYMIYD